MAGEIETQDWLEDMAGTEAELDSTDVVEEIEEEEGVDDGNSELDAVDDIGDDTADDDDSEADDTAELSDELDSDEDIVPEETKAEKRKKTLVGDIKDLRVSRREAREEAKQAKADFEAYKAETEQKMQKYDTLWEKLEAAQADKEEAERPQAPSYEEDPAGNLNHRLEEQAAQLEQTQQWREEQATQQKSQQEIQSLMGSVQAKEAAFVESNKDYYDAMAYLREMQKQSMAPIAKAKGMSDADVVAHMGQQELQMAKNLLDVNIDPAQYIYEQALRYGYKANAEGEPSKTGSEGSTHSDQLDTLEKGLKMAKGKGGSGHKKVDKDFVDNSTIPEMDAAFNEVFGQGMK